MRPVGGGGGRDRRAGLVCADTDDCNPAGAALQTAAWWNEIDGVEGARIKGSSNCKLELLGLEVKLDPGGQRRGRGDRQLELVAGQRRAQASQASMRRERAPRSMSSP